MSAVVTLTAVWLNAADDPSDAMSFTLLGDSLGVTSAHDVAVVAMAGGRTRLVTREGQTWSVPNAQLKRCTPEQVAWLRAHEGNVVWLRDWTGNKFAGVYAQVPVGTSTFFLDRGDVELSISSVSVSEAV